MRYLTLGVIFLCVIFGAGFWWRSGQVADLRLEIKNKEAQIDQYIRAAEVHREYVEQIERERAREDQIDRDINRLEGGDESASDYMRDAIRRMYQE